MSSHATNAAVAPALPADRRHPPLTKIIATIGPASSTAPVVRKLIEAGVSVFRLNFSHGTLDEHVERLATIRSIAAELDEPTAVLGDLPGPKIRVGTVAGDGIDLEAGATVVFQRDPLVATSPDGGEPVRFSTTYPGLPGDVEPGQRLLLNDGAVRMLIVELDDHAFTCTVTQGGLVTTGKGVNLPETELAIPSLTERDWRFTEWAIEHDLDALAMSFVRTAGNVRELAAGIERIASASGRRGYRLPVIAKIEVPKALAEIDAIADAADGLMVARGDLGVEMELSQVPIVQKRLIAVARAYGKPCIVATQMLESMIRAPSPTRAEVNDVATATFEQVDAVMLSGETAVGDYPVLAVDHMRRVAEVTGAYVAQLPQAASAPSRLVASHHPMAALAHGVWTVAQDVDARCIVVWSETGGGARYLSQNDFQVPIVAVTSDRRAARQMQFLRGVTPLVMAVPDGLSAFTSVIDAWLQETGRLRAGQTCILVAGEPLGQPRVTNSLAIHRVGDPNTGYARYGRR